MTTFGHVPLSPRLALPPVLQRAEWVVQHYDRDLRLRKSLEQRSMFVLERRCRKRPAVNTAMREYSDAHVQARDGYIHVSTVHPHFLLHPEQIIARIAPGDLWATGGAEKMVNELEYEEAFLKETRKRRRQQDFADVAREHFDLLNRHGNPDGTERTRISHPGRPA